MTNLKPEFKYHISGVANCLDSNSNLWTSPLHGDVGEKEVQFQNNFLICNYFKAAKDFIELEEYKALENGLKFNLQEEFSISDVSLVEIFLEKHGAFYHPSRLEVFLKQKEQAIIFVLNAAVSPSGLTILGNEYNALKKLEQVEGSDDCIPKVFGMSKMSSQNGKIAFFLGHWFEGFKEFHISDPFGRGKLDLWASEGDVSSIKYPEYFKIFEKASEILTKLYNLETFEQVVSWHHAAGDFITRQLDNDFEVRLISVRGYSSMVETNSDSQDLNIEDINKGLLLFFLNLSLRMRIDRINGIGDYHFIHEDIVHFILKGFFNALSDKKLKNNHEESIHKIFGQFLMQFKQDDLYQILQAITGTDHEARPETRLIKENLKDHSVILYNQIREMS